MGVASTPVRRVAIHGEGLAAWLAAAFLRAQLPAAVEIVVAENAGSSDADALYGQVLPPEIYDLHLGLGLDEPTLLLGTNTVFCLGTGVSGWGGHSWVQPFHLPLAPVENVPLHTLLAQDPRLSLQPFLVSAEAGRAGRFAHPPEDAANPLSRAEYGYLFDARELAGMYRTLAVGVPTVKADTDADFNIDTRMPRATGDSLFASLDRIPASAPEHALRRLRATADGWESEAVLANARLRLRVGSAADGGFAFTPHTHPEPWSGDTVRIGHAARVVDPLTVAPMRLLLRDLGRLVDLFPLHTDTTVEAREYNRACAEDTEHALIFHHAHFADVDLPDSPYFARAAADPHPKLVRKLRQYTERGYLVSYDHEPFEAMDWAVLHDGLRRKPRRSDALALGADGNAVGAALGRMHKGVEAVVRQMPPHPTYHAKLLQYLRRKGLRPNGTARHAG